ncbi:putative arogenate dehydratase [Helianthus annuus]|nr:putative arogenate dehydratase [Helianthus annuus]
MQTLSPYPKITFKPLMQTPSPSPSPDPHRLTFTVQSTARRYHSLHVKSSGSRAPFSVPFILRQCSNPTVSTTVPSAGKVVLQQQNTENTTGTDNNNHNNNNNDIITVVNNRNMLDLNLIPVNKLPKPLTNTSPAANHSSTLRVAYQGLPGAYSETAAGKAFPECKPIPCNNSELAFQSVELWIADRAVLPVENSLGGSVHRNYDLLLRHRLHIVGEIQISFRHCLVALPGVRTEHIKRVISHPQALAQCELTLHKLGFGFNHVAREAVADTAGAAEHVAANNLRDTAAIASPRAAEIYNLNILAESIQDDSSCVTRFMMLAREPVVARTDRPYKTSIVFAQDRGTTVLYKVLSAFEFRNIRLLKIESRPNLNRPVRVVDDVNVGTAKHFEYMFYVDFEASMADVRAQNAMAEVQEFTSFLRVLGSYPMDVNPTWGE